MIVEMITVKNRICKQMAIDILEFTFRREQIFKILTV